MSWWATGITAAMGVKKGMDNEKRMDKNDQFRKAAITYAPWTGMGDPGSQQLPGAMESGISGAATGAMMGSAMKGTGAADSTNAVGSGSPMGADLGATQGTQQMEALKFSPQEMQGAGKYTAMGQQPGSAGALGTTQMPAMNAGPSAQAPGQMVADQNNPLFKYMLMNQQK